MRGAYKLAIKEFKDLIRDRYILLSVILAPFIASLLMMGLTALVARETTGTLGEIVAKLPESVAVILEDPGDEMARMVALRLGVSIESSLEDALVKYPIVIILHSNFTKSILDGGPARATIVFKLERLPGFIELTARMSIQAVLEDIVRSIVAERFNVNLNMVRSPLVVDREFMYKGERIDEARLLSIQGLSWGFALVTFILCTVSIQIGALSIGFEREARTLELLLTLPIRRWEFIVGKLLGISPISLISLASFIVGLIISIYLISAMIITSFERLPGAGDVTGNVEVIPILNVVNLIREVSPFIVLVIIASLALALIASAVTGLLIGILVVGDMRGALTTGSYVGLVLASPLLVEIMGLTPPTWLQLILLLSPLYPPFKLAQVILQGDITLALVYSTAIIVDMIILVALASILVRSERLLYGLRFKRRVD